MVADTGNGSAPLSGKRVFVFTVIQFSGRIQFISYFETKHVTGGVGRFVIVCFFTKEAIAIRAIKLQRPSLFAVSAMR